MDKEKEIEDRHEISGIIYDCIRESDGNFTVPMLSRRITRAGYGNVEQAVKEFAEKLKDLKIHFCLDQECADRFDKTIDELYHELYGEVKE